MLFNMSLKVGTLKVEAGHAAGELREVEYILFRTISILRRMGLPENVQQAIQILAHLVLVTRLAHTAFIMMQSMTPYGWITAGISLASAGITIAATSGMLPMGDTIYGNTVGR